MSGTRTRWAAIGAAVAVTLGAGGLGVVNAVQSSGERGVYTAIEPCRLVDTRPAHGIGGRTSPLGPAENYQLQGTGDNGECTGIPGDAIALALNVTPVGPTRSTNLRFFPGGPVPNASSLNPAPGQPPTPNAVTVDLANDGSFRVYNFQGQVHLVADIVGYYRDHNHDDRYFTKAQTNAQLELTKFLSINVYADPALNFDDRYANLSDSGVGGLNVDVDFNFTIPPDYTTGTPLRLRLLAYSRNAPCQVALLPNWTFISRADVGNVSDGTSSLIADDEDAVSFGETHVAQEWWYSIDSSTPLEPGDAVGFGVFSSSSGTFCDLIVTGASVYYE